MAYALLGKFQISVSNRLHLFFIDMKNSLLWGKQSKSFH